MKSGVLGDISLPAHAGPPSAGQKNSRGRISASPADPCRHIAAGIQRAGTLYSVPALVSWSYSFLRIPATVLSIAEAKSEESRDFVGFSSGISRDKVGASPILPEVPAQQIVNDGKSVQKYSYPYWFPFTPYTEVFPRLFPWAIFSADEEFFEENDMNLWREYHCYYDKEDGEWLVVGDTFEEFRKKLSPMRSIDHAGEVAEYMMILSLNELGKAFLNVDKFVSQNQPYASTRPNAE